MDNRHYLVYSEDYMPMMNYLSTFGQFDTNYIFFRNVEIFKNYFLQIKIYIVKDDSEHIGIFYLLK
jgi:hypothetical protein